MSSKLVDFHGCVKLEYEAIVSVLERRSEVAEALARITANNLFNQVHGNNADNRR